MSILAFMELGKSVGHAIPAAATDNNLLAALAVAGSLLAISVAWRRLRVSQQVAA